MGVRLSGKDIAGLVQCAEAGMNQRETAEMLEFAPSTVHRAAVQFGIKFDTYRDKSNGRRKQLAMDGSKSVKPPSQYNNSRKPTQPKHSTSAKARRVIDAIGNDKQRNRSEAIKKTNEKTIAKKNQRRIDDVLKSDRPNSEKFELIYFIKFLAHEEKHIRQGKRPQFPNDRYIRIANACNERLRKRNAIMSELDLNEFKIAADIAFGAKLSVKSCSQMLDVIYREGGVDRRQVQRNGQENKHKKVYEYVKTEKGNQP